MFKLRYYFSMAVIILAMGLLLYGYYLAFWPYEVVTLNHSPIKVLSKEIKPGEYLQYQMNFTKHMNIKPETSYYLVDGSIVKLNAAGNVNRPVGKQIRNSEVLIPKSTRPNKYHIQIDLVYRINPLQTKYYTWVSEEFTVK